MTTQPVVLISIEQSRRGARFDTFDTFEEALRALEYEAYDMVRIGDGCLLPIAEFLESEGITRL